MKFYYNISLIASNTQRGPMRSSKKEAKKNQKIHAGAVPAETFIITTDSLTQPDFGDLKSSKSNLAQIRAGNLTDPTFGDL